VINESDRVAVVEAGELPRSLAVEYLKLYLGPADWERHLGALWTRLSRSGRSQSEARLAVRQAFAVALLLRVHDPSRPFDRERPWDLLHRAYSWDQAKERDWWADFQEVVAHDRKIEHWRDAVCRLGYIDPIDCAPYTRQAFNWLWERAEREGSITPETKEEISRRHENMVKAYGGAALSNLFLEHEDALRKVLNYRTGYFVERVLLDVYDVEQIVKIKTVELGKTNPQLVKRFQ
jgi:hypothetical protein